MHPALRRLSREIQQRGLFLNTLYHMRIAHAVFDSYLSPKAFDIVMRYNFNTDFYAAIGWKALQYKIFPLFPVARHWYRRSDHFDEMSECGEIVSNWHHHYNLIAELADDAKYPVNKLMRIFRILGRSSHALSDITAHSNIVLLLYEYFQTEPNARKKVEESGKSIDDYLSTEGPTFGRIINEDEFADFREKYFPRYFSYQSIRDVGPRSHSECNMDSPKSPACAGNPRIFEIAFNIAQREAVSVIHGFFEKLKTDNPAKYKAITEAFRDDAQKPDEPGKYTRRAQFWAQKVGGWD